MRTRSPSALTWMTIVLFAVFLAAPAWAGAVLRVKHDATGTPADGMTWENAYRRLQDALTVATSGDEIWVAAGMYRPTTGTDRASSFVMKEGVAIYGGYCGTDADERDWSMHTTILSGDINDTGALDGNAYTVVTGASDARLDGFTITGGNADEDFMFAPDNDPSFKGGGMYNASVVNLVVANCVFIGNSVRTEGGGMCNSDSSLAITNCLFVGNSANVGGGILNWNCSPAITNCTFYGNSAVYGGGICSGGDSNLAITNCVFWGNTAPLGGPCIYTDGTSSSIVTYSCVEEGHAGDGNIDDYPMFVDADAGDFRLRAGSPCIDAGDTTAVPAGVTTDLAGKPRIFGTSVDMGAYERQAPLRILRVKQGASGASDGSTWDDAFPCLQEALAAALPADEIRVAAGTYRPSARTDSEDPRSATFTMVEGVDIYGGYCGTDDNLRNLDGNKTILSGDLLDDDGEGWTNRTDNSYTVVTGASNARLDGFTITGGNADGSYPKDCGGGMTNWSAVDLAIENCMFSGNWARYGGGMFNSSGSPTITNCTFSGNEATFGGGMYNYDCDPTITNCTFSGNVASFAGGICNYESSPTITNCVFSGNEANWGGVMYNHDSSLTITNCTFSGNSATGGGGGMYNYLGSPAITDCAFTGNTAPNGGGIYNDHSSPAITNCTFGRNESADGGGGMYNNRCNHLTIADCFFRGNSADQGGGIYNDSSDSMVIVNCAFVGNSAEHGGGLFNYDCDPTITNCTFSGNSAAEGGGMYNDDSGPIITNCIIWGNSAGSGGELSVYNCDDSDPNVSYSCVEGWDIAENDTNIDEDPMFVRAPSPGPDGEWGTEDDDYGDLRLRAGSPCIDTGDSDAVPNGIETDLDGNLRIFDEFVDMGAYEFQAADEGSGRSKGCAAGSSGISLVAVALLLFAPLAERKRYSSRNA